MLPRLHPLARSAKTLASLCARSAGAMLRQAGAWLHEHSGWLLCAQAMLLLGIALGLYPHDEAWLAVVREPVGGEHHQQLNSLARTLSHAGDFDRLSLGLLAVLLLRARFSADKASAWRAVAMACLLSSMLSGLGAVSLRFMLGRARPVAHAQGVFTGPDLRRDYQGCPSGHSATAFGAAVPLLIARPALGSPLVLLACGVAWSRVYLAQHYPTDVAAGLWTALWCGLPLGLAARRAR